mmetsp:Transcript_13423/g.19204  ORF Transcript_13423/g.19204 Transcript_13423/m.19204 type:complete len:82 (+) Transcript_13423:2254-2499(+)
MPAPTIALIKLKDAPIIELLVSSSVYSFTRRVEPPGVEIGRMIGFLADGAKKGDFVRGGLAAPDLFEFIFVNLYPTQMLLF